MTGDTELDTDGSGAAAADAGAARGPGSVCCPSAQASWDGSVAIGVVGGTTTQPVVGYLAEHLPVTDDLLALTGPVQPDEVFRFAAPCAGDACQHFDGQDCRLVTKIVTMLPAVVEVLPSCKLRPTCRWWLQEGRAACRRCPQVVTRNYLPSATMVRVTDPAV